VTQKGQGRDLVIFRIHLADICTLWVPCSFILFYFISFYTTSLSERRTHCELGLTVSSSHLVDLGVVDECRILQTLPHHVTYLIHGNRGHQVFHHHLQHPSSSHPISSVSTQSPGTVLASSPLGEGRGTRPKRLKMKHTQSVAGQIARHADAVTKL